MNFVDKALARRLEAAEEIPQVYYAQIDQKLRPEIGSAVEEICGGHMSFAGVGSPVGRAGGIGFDGPISAADLDRIEGFYRSHGGPCQVDVCPLTDPSLIELLKTRGYSMSELNNVLFRPLIKDEVFPEPAYGNIRPGKKEEAAVFTSIVERCFFPNGDAPKEFGGVLAPMFQMEGGLNFVVEVDGNPVACAAGLRIKEHGIVGLFGAGTLTEFRGRGLQTALLRTRMAVAAQAGCEYAVIVTQGGTTSQRNAERLGFRVAYSKATLVKKFENS